MSCSQSRQSKETDCVNAVTSADGPVSNRPLRDTGLPFFTSCRGTVGRTNPKVEIYSPRTPTSMRERQSRFSVCRRVPRQVVHFLRYSVARLFQAKAGADPHRALACLICRCLASAEGCPHQGYLSADFECRLAVVVASPAGSLFAAGGMVLIRGRIPQRGADSSTPSSGSSCRSFGSSPQKEWCWRCRSRQFPSLGRRKMSRPRPAMHPCLHACDPEQAPAPIVGHPGWRQKPDWRLPDRRPGSGPMRM